MLTEDIGSNAGVNDDSGKVAIDEASSLLPCESQLAIAYISAIVEHIGMAIELLNREKYNNNEDIVATLPLTAEFQIFSQF